MGSMAPAPGPVAGSTDHGMLVAKDRAKLALAAVKAEETQVRGRRV